MRVEGEARSQPPTQMSVRPLALWHSRSLGERDGRACEPQRSDLRWRPCGRQRLARGRTAPAELSRRWLDFHAVAAIRARGSLCGANADGSAQRHTHNAPTWPISVIATTRTFGSRQWLALGRASRQSRGLRRRSIGAWRRAGALAAAPRVPVLPTRSPRSIWPISVLARRARAMPTPAVAERSNKIPTKFPNPRKIQRRDRHEIFSDFWGG